ncbi:MAG TPA: CoA pyrophosphatase [Syntrophales bacterium]|nr:CoA pyrophosphatase [Syntrophales bacterium]HOM06671.1 CoA pyrophosphatase [Syntrophales bacterium]HOO00141.1 CoA pyrophosphatase [Syntrophales bacterium]HPC01926.1 CoA pyrophosphatase [Syntrophales bacterium]HPQ06332.1 CoA pyrophosphatase [Syntrophales bacterium]
MIEPTDGILPREGDIPQLVRERLGRSPLDYAAKRRLIGEDNAAGRSHSAAGVLLLLTAGTGPDVVGKARPALQLIKRSDLVPQGGDLSCPGGILNPAADGAFGFLMRYLPFPFFGGPAKAQARARDRFSYRLITTFFANALRETWEEIGLNPAFVRFLGPLPTYSLHMFRRTIFPLVGWVKGGLFYRPNEEVAKIVEIPIENLFEEKRYARYTIEADPRLPTPDEGPWDFPCFLHEDTDGTEEILWGATFFIVMNFLRTVWGFTPPGLGAKRQRRRSLRLDYLKGGHG